MKNFWEIASDNLVRGSMITTFNTVAGFICGQFTEKDSDYINNAMNQYMSAYLSVLGFATGIKYSIVSSIAHHLMPDEPFIPNIIGNLIVDIGVGLYDNTLEKSGWLFIVDCLDLILEVSINDYLI